MVLHQTQLKLTQTLTASQLKIMTAGRSIKMYGEYSIKTLKSRKSAIEVFRTVITSQPEMSGVGRDGEKQADISDSVVCLAWPTTALETDCLTGASIPSAYFLTLNVSLFTFIRKQWPFKNVESEFIVIDKYFIRGEASSKRDWFFLVWTVRDDSGMSCGILCCPLLSTPSVCIYINPTN